MKKHIISIAVFLLVLLWVYAATSKLLDLEQSRLQMLNQVFPKAAALALIWLVPLTELIVAALLMVNHLRVFGLYLSALLLSAFSSYISLIKLNLFGRVPCSCGGIFQQMGWGAHLIFNLCFLFVALVGINLSRKEEQPSK